MLGEAHSVRGAQGSQKSSIWPIWRVSFLISEDNWKIIQKKFFSAVINWQSQQMLRRSPMKINLRLNPTDSPPWRKICVSRGSLNSEPFKTRSSRQRVRQSMFSVTHFSKRSESSSMQLGLMEWTFYACKKRGVSETLIFTITKLDVSQLSAMPFAFCTRGEVEWLSGSSQLTFISTEKHPWCEFAESAENGASTMFLKHVRIQLIFRFKFHDFRF